LVTKDISKAKMLCEDLTDFLENREKISRKAVEKKVLIVTSHKDHKKNVLELKNVDDKENSVEWIVSVSMLTEGWDVKNVFQIVPWEDRAFKSKLLIAQVWLW
jgi:type III restriction enzyme